MRQETCHTPSSRPYYPRPRRPQIGPDCSPARTPPPQPEFNPARIVSTPSPGRAVHQPACSHPITAEGSLMPGSAKTRRGRFPAPEGDPTPQREDPPLANCAVPPAVKRPSIAALSPYGYRRSLPGPTSQLASAPVSGNSRAGLCLWQQRTAPLPPVLHLPTQSPTPLLLYFPLFPFAPHSPECPKR